MEIGGVCNESGTPGFQIRSGVSGNVLFELTSVRDEHLGDPLARLGDVDNDGVDDFAVGNGGDFCCWMGFAGARVYSGASGTRLYQIDQWEWYDVYLRAIVANGDVDADGRADLALLTGDGSGVLRGVVEVRSDVDGSLLWQDSGTTDFEQLGTYSALVADRNADGVDDFAVGALAYTRVYDAVTGAVLRQYPVAGELADPGDFDGNGSLDLVIGENVISGTDGSVIRSFPGWPLLVPAGDVDQDGTVDFLAGNPTYDSYRGRAALLAGSSGSTIREIREGAHSGTYSTGASLGHGIVPVGDVTGDGQPDFLLSAPQQNGSTGVPEVGWVWLYSLVGWPPPQRFCVAAANSASASGAPIDYARSWAISNNDLEVSCTDLPPNHFGLFYYGPNQLQVPFGNGFGCVGGQIARLLPPLSSGPAGEVTRPLDFTVPPLGSGAGAVSAGMTRHFQYRYRDVPAGGAFFDLSDALNVTFSY